MVFLCRIIADEVWQGHGKSYNLLKIVQSVTIVGNDYMNFDYFRQIKQH